MSEYEKYIASHSICGHGRNSGDMLDSEYVQNDVHGAMP